MVYIPQLYASPSRLPVGLRAGLSRGKLWLAFVAEGGINHILKEATEARQDKDGRHRAYRNCLPRAGICCQPS